MNLKKIAMNLKGEEGFTLIEVLIAAFILVLGSLAVVLAFGAGIHNIQRSREQQIGVSVAQREIEKIKVTAYDEIGTLTLSAFSSNAKLPENRITTVSAKKYFNVNRKTMSEPRLMLEGKLEPSTAGVKSNDGTEVTVMRFVVCEEMEVAATACKAKRVIVDVLPVAKVNLANYQHSYYELQATVIDPTP